ncbi:MAG: metalloprotease PmbA [Proteobacteria bacterium]|nr:metalloprotease PmbA [Pseudomonadota bacterium]
MSQTDIVTKVLETVKRKGASSAELVYSEGSGVSVSCRNGELDTVENNHDKSLVITVYKGKAKGSASTAVVAQQSVDLTIEKALNIASLTEQDEASGLADTSLLAKDFKDLKTFYENQLSSEQMIEMALQASQATVDYAASKGQDIVVDEANVQIGDGYSIYANSHGFIGEKKASNVSMSVVAIAEKNNQMEREYWWDSARNVKKLQNPDIVGVKAAENTLQRLGSRKIKSCKAPVLFDPSMAKSLVGHMLSAISGSALYQESSFLKNDLGKKILPAWFELDEDPFVLSGFASRNFDGNGVQTHQRKLIDEGVLTGFLLSVYSARRLEMQTTGNAGGAHNLFVKPGDKSLDQLLKQMDTGLFVTSLMGQGVNPVTGDYSRGASGFWVENGEIQFPTSELTIADNLKDMYQSLLFVGNDVDKRSKIQTGSWLIEEMTIAGD